MKRTTRGRSPVTPSEVPVGNKRWLSVSGGAMKTTSGKSKPATKGKRLVYIYSEGRRGVIAQFEATSLRAALEEYHERMWKPNGWNRKIVGNVMQVFKGNNSRTYKALETYQSP